MRCGATRAPPQQVGASRHREAWDPLHLLLMKNVLQLLFVVLKNPIEVPVAPACRLAQRCLAVLHHRSRSPRLKAAGL